MPDEPDTVLHVDRSELEALASTKITIAEQERLGELLSRNSQKDLTPSELAELDSMLDRIDRLNLLKAKALLALQSAGGSP